MPPPLLRVSRALRQRAKVPEVQKLLYGKRKNAVHTTSTGRPTAATLLLTVNNDKLASTVRHTLALQELSSEDIVSVLKSNRALHRLDRTALLFDTLLEERYPLAPKHYSLLMAHANDQHDTKRALKFWQHAVQAGKVGDQLHGALLACYRNGGQWREAIEHCEAMWKDKMIVDPHALHAVMNACRRHGPWSSGLKIFSKAVQHGTKPNNVNYLELLRTIERATPMPARWKYSLAILDALQGKIDVNAGHYNAVLGTMGGPHLWKRGVALFQSMKEQSVQPSRDTLEKLLLLNSASVAHCVRCVAEAHALGMPVTDTMYRAVLSSLFQLGLDGEATQFAAREFKRDVEDVGHAFTSTSSLSIALIDSLLAHARPREALLVYDSFEDKLGDAVGPSTRGLGALGEPAQRWLVQGRVAVVDHNVLLSPRLESLSHHYDSIFIPFSSVRLLVRRARQMGASTQGRFTRYTFVRLERLLRPSEEWSRIARVLPLSHQLQAHQYIVGGPASEEALQLLREEAGAATEGRLIGERAREQPATGSLRQRLLASITNEEDSGTFPSAAHSTPHVPLRIRSAGAADSSVAIALENSLAAAPSTAQGPARPAARGGPVLDSFRLRKPDRMSSTERVLSVAVMLKSLNPDADVHVVSTNAVQLSLARQWTASKPHVPLTALKYPEELFTKAPPAGVVEGRYAQAAAPDPQSSRRARIA